MMRSAICSQFAICSLALAMVMVNVVSCMACPICIGFPKRTDADFLLEGWCVVLARPSQDDPFKYVPGEILKGVYDGSEIDLLVDSTSRRLLQVHQDCHVLLIQESRSGPWQNLGPVSAEFQCVAKRLLLVGTQWHSSAVVEQRWQFFLPLFGHPDRRISDMAYLELGRAPYSIVRQLGRFAPREAYSRILDNRQYIQWQGLAILLMAQSHSETDKQRIMESFQASMHFGQVTNLAAWTAAALEIAPYPTIEQVENEYFKCNDRKQEELDAVVLALSMHGFQGDSELQDRIIASYRLLLDRAPHFAPLVANDLAAWNRTELVEQLSAILRHRVGLDFGGVQSVQKYLRLLSADVDDGVGS